VNVDDAEHLARATESLVVQHPHLSGSGHDDRVGGQRRVMLERLVMIAIAVAVLRGLAVLVVGAPRGAEWPAAARARNQQE
jgi:hypothetical protein